MNLRRTLSRFGAVLSGLALLMVTTATHVSAASMPTHEMSGMNHSSSKSASCISLCTSAPIEKQQKFKDIDDEEDDDPLPLTSDTTNRAGDASNSSIPDNALSWRLLKVPLHVLYEVYRN